MTLSPRFFLPFAIVFVCFIWLTGCGSGGSSASPSIGMTDPMVTVTPIAPKMGVGANLQFRATVTGTSNTSVTWKINGIAGGNASVGTIDATGFYIAPGTMPNPSTMTVTAVAAANSSFSDSSIVTLSAADPLGTVSANQTIPCPSGVGVANATCYQLNVQCPAIADFTTYLKVNQPSGSFLGTVMFGTGTGGSNLYDNVFTNGTEAVQAVFTAGFTTVQVSFGEPFNHSTPNGWLTGPGGVRRLACRYATTAQWVYQNIHKANASAPLCGTGNSGGSAAIAYGITHYGLDSIFSMVEPTSGPPMARLDNGCICNAGSVPTACGQGQISICYDAAAAMLIDQAYGSSSQLCTQAAGNPANEAQFLSDSVNGPGANFAYPKTDVHVVFGGRDTSAAVPQGTVWLQSVTKAGSAPIPLMPSCVADSPHAIPDVLDGAQQIADDIKTRCKLQ